MNRRTVLAATATLPLASAASAAMGRSCKIYVLVHGTWLGGWIWADVADRLRAAGHQVYTPTLTGVGERAHLIGPDIGLETHIQDIMGVIAFEELRDVILVAHSFSGVAATGAADRMQDRIAHIAFFDALIPHAGRMTAVETNPDGSETDYFAKRRPGFVDGYKMVFTKDYPMKMLIDDDLPELQESVRRRLTPHPVRGWTDRLVLANGGWESLKRTCFRTTKQTFAPSSEKMWGPSQGPGWNVVELATGRMGMMTDPKLVAEAFLKL